MQKLVENEQHATGERRLNAENGATVGSACGVGLLLQHAAWGTRLIAIPFQSSYYAAC